MAEAASRGAAKVICNDYNRDCAEQIRANANLLALDSIVQVSCKDFRACLNDLARAGERFEFVFLDAPYKDGTAQHVCFDIHHDYMFAGINRGKPVARSGEGVPRRLDDAFDVGAAEQIGWIFGHTSCPFSHGLCH